jgi:hypothetical protein
MFSARNAWLSLFVVATIGMLLSACAKLNLGPGPVPTTSPSATASPTPGACQTQSPNANLVVVGMANAISPTTAPTFGPVGGYAPGNLSTHQFPAVAAVINQYVNAAGKTVPITSQNVLQFANVENIYVGVNHSAVGFKGEHFPTQPYPFPSAAPLPIATAISATSFWSTGRIADTTSNSGGPCFSQVFTLKPGVYYFGDLDYYNVTTTTFRDVLVVGTPVPRVSLGHVQLYRANSRFTRDLVR